MQDTNPATFTFRRKDQAVNLASKNSVRIKDDIVQIDPNLMFQRLASSAAKSDDGLKETLKFELCTFPPALFDNTGIMKQPKKAQLAETLLQLIGSKDLRLPGEVQYVLDGRALLYKIPS